MKSSTLNKAVEIAEQFKKTVKSKLGIADKFDKIITMLAKEMNADAAACYLVVDDNYLELFASYAFNPELNNNIALKVGEGIIGGIAKSKLTTEIENIWEHPDFLYRADADEEKYKSFLGTPIIRWGRAIGVLCLYKKNVYEFKKSEINTLEMLSMEFSDWVASDAMREYKNAFIKKRGQNTKDKYKGLSLSKGYGFGPAVVHRRRQAVTKIFADDKQLELERLLKAHTDMNADLDEKFNASKLGIGEHADILDAYRMFAKDKGWYNKIAGHVDGGLTAEAAVERAYEDMWNRLSATQDVYLKERLHDLRDVADRLLAYLSGDNSNIKANDLGEMVIVAQTMGPADLMDYDYHKIKALILEDGTATMHVAIVAKALGIPVVSKIKGLFKDIKNGELLAVDGDNGIVYIRPSDKIIADFNKKIAEKDALTLQMAELKKLPSKTLDKQRINTYINVGLDFDLDYIESTNCDGIGLYRTEIPFMAAEKMPDVEHQVSYYKKLLDMAGNKKVVFRSLDVGSDKLLPYWTYSGEENPAIGWRSIRITLDRRAILRQQMRAFIRAAAGKELNVMFPMIANLNEFLDAKETLMIELDKEKKRSNEIPKKVNVGLMVEVPSVVFQLDAILPEADFVSVGTNDLAQFFFACDRMNNRLAERYDVLSVPFLRIMREIIQKANDANVFCSVCGEMASNPIEAMVLLGLGYRNLSISGASFGKVKKMIRSANTKELADYVGTLLDFNRRTLRPQLIAYANDHGIEIF
ncbi:MAG: phosphoenolpyruvate--protein phosphotransferase [Alphaproteobacteria bacterium]|nr:phosphoenolpyruvate--protein phosphotransferase [Alphaproteobacteria bacterium]